MKEQRRSRLSEKLALATLVLSSLAGCGPFGPTADSSFSTHTELPVNYFYQPRNLYNGN